jgi:hypothetical protein
MKASLLSEWPLPRPTCLNSGITLLSLLQLSVHLGHLRRIRARGPASSLRRSSFTHIAAAQEARGHAGRSIARRASPSGAAAEESRFRGEACVGVKVAGHAPAALGLA